MESMPVREGKGQRKERFEVEDYLARPAKRARGRPKKATKKAEPKKATKSHKKKVTVSETAATTPKKASHKKQAPAKAEEEQLTVEHIMGRVVSDLCGVNDPELVRSLGYVGGWEEGVLRDLVEWLEVKDKDFAVASWYLQKLAQRAWRYDPNDRYKVLRGLVAKERVGVEMITATVAVRKPNSQMVVARINVNVNRWITEPAALKSQVLEQLAHLSSQTDGLAMAGVEVESLQSAMLQRKQPRTGNTYLAVTGPPELQSAWNDYDLAMEGKASAARRAELEALARPVFLMQGVKPLPTPNHKSGGGKGAEKPRSAQQNPASLEVAMKAQKTLIAECNKMREMIEWQVEGVNGVTPEKKREQLERLDGARPMISAALFSSAYTAVVCATENVSTEAYFEDAINSIAPDSRPPHIFAC